MANFNRMTIRSNGVLHQVIKLKPRHQHAGTVCGGGHRVTSWSVPALATVRFEGTYAECMVFIESQGAQYMSEHGIPC